MGADLSVTTKQAFQIIYFRPNIITVNEIVGLNTHLKQFPCQCKQIILLYLKEKNYSGISWCGSFLQTLPRIKLQIAVLAILMFWNEPRRWIFL